MKKLSFFFIFLCIGNFSFGQPWTTSSSNINDIHNTNSGNVGIGTTTPVFKLDVRSVSSLPGGLTGAFIGGEATSASTNSVQGLISRGHFSHTSGTAALLIALSGSAYLTDAGSVTSMRSIQGNVTLLGAGNCTNGYAFFGAIGAGGTGTVTNGYGLYISPFGSSTVNKWGVYIDDINAKNYFGGSIGIGTTNPGTYKLAVEGKIGAREIRVSNENPWADYVFKPDYKLPSLKEIETFIKEKGHLEGIPSAEEVKREGYDMSVMDANLLKKIEELTLHIIELNKKVEALSEGKIGAREVQILNTSSWPDFVFQPDYKLLPLAEVEECIKQHSHLPDVPSANHVKDGVELGKMNAILIQKIEELTLYVIELKKENTDLKQQMETIQNRITK